MSAPPNWRGEFRGFDEGAAGGASAAAASSAGSDAAREELERLGPAPWGSFRVGGGRGEDRSWIQDVKDERTSTGH